MAHNKSRADTTVGDVDWTKPKLSALLEKVGEWSIDNRSHLPPHQVQIRIASGWHAGAADKSALLLAQNDGALVLATSFPLARGGDVQVIGLPGGGSSALWAVVSEEREGIRVEDQGQELYLSWLHPR